jgi:hypothetical protein
VNALDQEKAQGHSGHVAVGLLIPISSFSMNWATCRSAHQAAQAGQISVEMPGVWIKSWTVL